MLIDQFTKWIQCFPLPGQLAELVAKIIVYDFFTRMGTPLEIHSNKGSNFVSNPFSTLSVLLQITKTCTTNYRPCSNGQIEHMNRQVLQMFFFFYVIKTFVTGIHICLILQELSELL